MNKVYGLILLFAISVLLCSCRGQDNKHLKKEQVDQIENDIVFICNRQYDMNGLVNKGFFIDKFGNIGTFDFPLSEEAMEYANINELYTYLAKHYHEYETSPYIEENMMLECYNYLLKIDSNAKVRNKHKMYDYGMAIIYGIRTTQTGENEIIMLDGFGDYRQHNLDKNVGPILRILHDWQDILSEIEKRE